MAVPSSGELELRGDIALEVYGVATGSNISLGTMSNLAGFSDPDAMSEFYGYSSADAPSVTTNNISNVAETSVTLNGNVTSDGGATITERGFYFGTNSSSPTNNTKYTVSGTTGYYSSNRTGLSASTTYYCWAFATNSKGTTYGSRVQATTVAAFTPTYIASTDFQFDQCYYTKKTDTYESGGVFEFITYYINPNTSSAVQYMYSFSFVNDGTGTSYWYTAPASGDRKICTNARNYSTTYTNSVPTDSYAANSLMRVGIQKPANASQLWRNVQNYALYSGDTLNYTDVNSARFIAESTNTNNDGNLGTVVYYDYY